MEKASSMNKGYSNLNKSGFGWSLTIVFWNILAIYGS